MRRRTTSGSFTTSCPRIVARARVGFEDGREDAHGGGLAGAVRAEQPEHGPGLHLRTRRRRGARTLPLGKTLTRSCASTARKKSEENAIEKET